MNKLIIMIILIMKKINGNMYIKLDRMYTKFTIKHMKNNKNDQ